MTESEIKTASKTESKTASKPTKTNARTQPSKSVDAEPRVKLLQLMRLKGEVADRVRRELPRQTFTDSWGKRYIFRPNAADFQELVDTFAGKGSADDEYGMLGTRGEPLRQIFSGHGAVTANTAKRLMKNPAACFLLTWPDRESSTLVTFYIFNDEMRGPETLVKTTSRDDRKSRASAKFGRSEADDAETETDTSEE